MFYKQPSYRHFNRETYVKTTSILPSITPLNAFLIQRPILKDFQNLLEMLFFLALFIFIALTKSFTISKKLDTFGIEHKQRP